MKATLTKIGESKGIIIPKHFLEECQIDNVVTIKVENDTLVISKPSQPRSGWEESFANASMQDQEMLIEDTLPNDFDNKEWSW